MPFRACSILTSSANGTHLPWPVSFTLSVDNSLAKCKRGNGRRKVKDLTRNRYWGTSETLLPVYQTVEKAIAKHTDVNTVVNFASSRSVYTSTLELMEFPQIKSIAIIAEGVPERRAREILHTAQKKGITIIGRE